MKIRSIYYYIPPKSLIIMGGEVRSRHARSSHAWHKRQASRKLRRVSKAFTYED